jgi:hypothetical protein
VRKQKCPIGYPSGLVHGHPIGGGHEQRKDKAMVSTLVDIVVSIFTWLAVGGVVVMVLTTSALLDRMKHRAISPALSAWLKSDTLTARVVAAVIFGIAAVLPGLTAATSIGVQHWGAAIAFVVLMLVGYGLALPPFFHLLRMIRQEEVEPGLHVSQHNAHHGVAGRAGWAGRPWPPAPPCRRASRPINPLVQGE